MEIFLAIVLGTLFGYVLQRVGAADPDKIIGMLRLSDLHLMKVILAGIGISSALLFTGLLSGILDTVHFDIKAMYWGVIIGGLMLGFGWAIGGYCPGTGIVAAGSGRIDGLFFILGGLVGAGLYTVTYVFIEDTWIFQKVFGGKISLVTTGQESAIINLDWSPILAVTLGLLMLVAAWVLPARKTPNRKTVSLRASARKTSHKPA